MSAIDAPSAMILGMPRRRAVALTRWAIVIGAALALEIYGRLFADPSFFQPLTAIARAWVNPVMSDERIIGALGMAIVEIAFAYSLSIIFGAAIGMAIGGSNFARASFLPIVLLLYAIPQVSLMPLFVLVFGLGAASKIAFGFSHGVFPVIVNVVAGMRNTNPLHLRAMRSMGGTRADELRHVVFPNMVPSFFVGLRLAMTMTMLGVILAELYVSTGGIGYFTRVFAENYNPAPLFALTGALAIIAVAFNSLVRVAERRLTPGGRATARPALSGAQTK
jgi:ABC-type nitrate/sulfonate/bicarbonate transport system permease component